MTDTLLDWASLQDRRIRIFRKAAELGSLYHLHPKQALIASLSLVIDAVSPNESIEHTWLTFESSCGRLPARFSSCGLKFEPNGLRLSISADEVREEW